MSASLFCELKQILSQGRVVKRTAPLAGMIDKSPSNGTRGDLTQGFETSAPSLCAPNPKSHSMQHVVGQLCVEEPCGSSRTP